MNAHDVIKYAIDSTAEVVTAYLGDLTDAELFHRPAEGCNHINWQVGHLIMSENLLIEKVLPGTLPPLPPGFAEKYSMETTKLDDPALFCSKAALLDVHKQQRTAVLAALAKTSATDLDKPCEGWTPNLGTTFVGASATHWLMHAGQWAVIRRQLAGHRCFDRLP